MSIATYISSIETSRNTIRAKLVELGMAASNDKLDKLATAIEGIVNQGAISVEIKEGTSYAIPAGYHNGSGTVKAISDVAGDAEAYKTQKKTVTPTKNQQPVNPDSGYYALESVTVLPIPEAYQDVSSVTATKDDVLTGKVFVTADGTVTTGAMANHGAIEENLDVTTISYTIPKGYHNGTGTVQLVLETKSVTPNKALQRIVPASGKVLSEVTVNPIPSEYQDVTEVTVLEDEVLADKKFVSADGEVITGTMPNVGTVNKTLDVNSTSFSIDKGYHSGDGVVNIVLETKEVTPKKEVQNVTPTSGKVLSKVTVAAIPDNYQDVTGVTATVDNVLEDNYFVTSSGELKEGTMANKGAIKATIDGLTTTSYTIPKGYHNGTGTVSLTADIEEALQRI